MGERLCLGKAVGEDKLENTFAAVTQEGDEGSEMIPTASNREKVNSPMFAAVPPGDANV